MLRRLYDWTLALSGRPDALWVLGAIAFIESSIFPIPPDVLIIPMVLAAPDRAWRIAIVATIASVIGGYAGYGIGAFFYSALGQPLLAFYGYEENFTQFQIVYNEWGAWFVAVAGLTPFPYKFITIASGVTNLDPLVFGIASVFSRGARFFLIAALLKHFGTPIRSFIEKNLGILTVVFFLLLFGGFIVVKYIV